MKQLVLIAIMEALIWSPAPARALDLMIGTGVTLNENYSWQREDQFRPPGEVAVTQDIPIPAVKSLVLTTGIRHVSNLGNGIWGNGKDAGLTDWVFELKWHPF